VVNDILLAAANMCCRHSKPNNRRLWRVLRCRCGDDSRNVCCTGFGAWHHAVDDWVSDDCSCEERDCGSG
jgi:hypothetical protein